MPGISVHLLSSQLLYMARPAAPVQQFNQFGFFLFRIFAPICASCGISITPVEGTDDTVRVVAMEKDFHVDCYVCEVSTVPKSGQKVPKNAKFRILAQK